MKLSVVIPCYNEEKRIGATLEKVLPYLEQHTDAFEVLIVNDGSSDKTADIVQQFKHPHVRVLSHTPNKGKGYSVREGMLASKYDWVLFSDADLSTPIEELAKLRQHCNTHSVIIGSRALADSDIVEKQPFYRVFLGKTCNKIVQSLGLWGVKDTQCGFKLFSQQATQDIFNKQYLDGFSFDIEALFLAKRLGHSIKEVPITWKNSPESKVDPVKDSLRMFKDMFHMRWKHRKT